MAFIPHLNFDGNCAEAMQFYASIFHATETRVMLYSDVPEGERMPPSNRVVYSHIMVGENCLMGSDYPLGMQAKPQESVSVNHPVADVETGRKLFDALAEGGEVTMPFEATFFSAGFGMVRDRFGTKWMIGVSTT